MARWSCARQPPVGGGMLRTNGPPPPTRVAAAHLPDQCVPAQSFLSRHGGACGGRRPHPRGGRQAVGGPDVGARGVVGGGRWCVYLSWSRTLSCQVRVGGQWCDAMTPPPPPGRATPSATRTRRPPPPPDQGPPRLTRWRRPRGPTAAFGAGSCRFWRPVRRWSFSRQPSVRGGMLAVWWVGGGWCVCRSWSRILSCQVGVRG